MDTGLLRQSLGFQVLPSATKASPYAISGSIKDSCLEGEGHVKSFVAQIALFCFLKIGAVSAILQLNDFYRSP